MAPRTGRRFTPPTPAGSAEFSAPKHPVGQCLLHHPSSAPAGVGALVLGVGAVASSVLATGFLTTAHAMTDDLPGAEEVPTRTIVENDPQHTGTAPSGAGSAPSPFWSTALPDAPPSSDTVADHAATAEPGAGAGAHRVVEGTVTVRSGESLWSISQELLGPGASDEEIAAAWPQLWAANGDRIVDPDLLRPGTVLHLPSALLAPE